MMESEKKLKRKLWIIDRLLRKNYLGRKEENTLITLSLLKLNCALAHRLLDSRPHSHCEWEQCGLEHFRCSLTVTQPVVVIGPVVSGSRLPAFLPVELSVAWSLFWVWHVADPPTEKNHMVPPGCWGRESVDPFQCSEDRCICITASMCRGKHCVLKTLLCIFSFFYLLFRWITSREWRESIVPRRMGCQKENGA